MSKSRKKISRLVAVLLVAVMLCTVLCGVSFASDWNMPSEHKEFGRDMFDSADWRTLYDYMVTTLSGAGQDFDYYDHAVVCYEPRYWQNNVGYYCVALVKRGTILNTDGIGTIITDVPNSVCVFFSINTYGHSPSRNSYGSAITVQGVGYSYSVAAGGSWNNPAFSYGNIYCDCSLRGNPANMTYKDTRFLSIEPFRHFESDYLSVSTDADVESHGSLLTVYYTDSQGSFSYGFQPYQYLDLRTVDDDYYNFKVNISSIPSTGQYTITGAELASATSWGTKGVTLDLTYSGTDISLPSNYTNITYFTNFVESQNNSSIGATFKSNLYFGVYDNGQGFYLRDGEDYLVQNFDVKFIALPDFLWNPNGSDVANWDLEEYYEIFESYDVVILGLGQFAFDELYGVGLYLNLYNNFVTVSAVLNQIEKWTPEYVSTPKELFDEHIQDFEWSNYWSNIGFIVTRNYLLKKIFYVMGDTSDILLDFESKLLSETGSLASIESKLVLMLGHDNDFYNDAVDFFQSVKAFNDNLTLIDFYNRVLDILDAIKSKLSTTFEPLTDIPEPFLTIYKFFTGVLTDMVDLLPDFQAYANKAVNPDVPMFPTPVPTVPLIPTLGGGYDVVPY